MALKLYCTLKNIMLVEKTVLLIDDDKEDLEMLQDALKTIDINHKILEAHDGIQGLAKLKELNEQNILPCLIVLDINMPKLDGKQTFVTIKNNSQLSKIPIVIFSTSSSLCWIKPFLKGITQPTL
jgi:CheY-like chemotaxis protein